MAAVNVAQLPVQELSCFAELEERFENLIPCFTRPFPDESETWPESVRLRMKGCIAKMGYQRWTRLPPDNSSRRGFKINQPKLLIGVQI